jgi:metal-responsive CopG/Arc/MetJ family transcriptional regulator
MPSYMYALTQTDEPRILLSADKSPLRRLDDFHFGKRINTRSEAIRRLLEGALKEHEKTGKITAKKGANSARNAGEKPTVSY